MNKLSAPQRAIYEFIKEYQEARGYPPSVREICIAVGSTSTSTIHGHLTRLEKKGLIKRDPTKPRAIEIMELQAKKSDSSRLPMVGRVAAGKPILANEDIQEYLSVPASFIKTEDAFILTISGDSMKNAGILDGDMIVVQPNIYIENGDIAVAMITDESTGESVATCKRFYKESTRVRLQPENEEYEPIYATNDIILVGKVISLLRKIS